MVKYRLIYFDLRGRGELIRMIFHTAGVKFEDTRVDYEKEWPKLKPKMPSGQVPVLEIEGKMFTQSSAIARYLATEFGLNGTTGMEKFEADIVVDILNDLVAAFYEFFFFEKDETKKTEMKKKFQSETLPKELDHLNSMVNEHGHFVGKTLTWADIYFHHFITTMNVNEMISPEMEKNCQHDGLHKIVKAVESHEKLSAYIKARPDHKV